MLHKLRARFVCTNMLIATLMLCIIFGLVLDLTKSNLEQQSIHMMRAASGIPEHGNGPEMPPPEVVHLPFFTVHLDPDGNVLRSKGKFLDLSDEKLLSELIAIAMSGDEQVQIIPGYSLRSYRQEAPFGISIVFADTTSETQILYSLIRTCILVGLLSFFAFLGISILLARWAVRPVENAWNQQKQFTADASHELKTPLTVIMTNAELMQSDEYDETEKREFLSSILTMSRQMQGLVQQLLNMARLDNAEPGKNVRILDFSELIQDAVMPFEPLFYENALSLVCHVQDGVCVRGCEDQLTQLIEIYLDNARKYAHPGTEVTLRLTEDRGKCVLAVQSQGDPIGPEDLKLLFKRFYRADKARTMNQSYGLGLAIAESIAQSHKGSVWATSQNGVNTFYTQLPKSK